MESILWLLAIPGFLALGFFFVWVFVLIISRNTIDSNIQDLQSKASMFQWVRSREKSEVLFWIGPPECPDGTFSPRQMAMWNRYKILDEQDREMTAQERNVIVNTQTVIDDQVLYELENGINPY